MDLHPLIPAPVGERRQIESAGIQIFLMKWIPAFAGMSGV